jgi:hypothetical protein
MNQADIPMKILGMLSMNDLTLVINQNKIILWNLNLENPSYKMIQNLTIPGKAFKTE